jgi:eukaryotic-like serine/threonine-protein kinase
MKHFLLLGSLLLLGCGMSTPNNANASHTAHEKIKKLDLDWQYSLNSQVASTPVVAGNQLFVAAENGNLYSFDLPGRTFSWLYHTEAGIASTPVVANGIIYFLSRDGFFYALEQATGKRLWRFATGGEGRFAATGGYGLPVEMGPVPDPWDFYLSSPVVHNGKVYFGSTDKHLYALNATTGEVAWSFVADEAIHSSPVIHNGKVFFGTWGTKIYALDAETGIELWHHQGGTDPQYFAMQGITATPVADNNNVYVGARDGFVYALRQADGAVVWRYDAAYSWILAGAALDDTNIYIATSDTGLLLALDKQTGTEKYRADTRLWTYTTPLLVQDRYAFVGTMAGELYGFDKNTGKKLWYYQTPEGRADINDIVDGKTGKLRGEKLFAPEMQTQAGVELVKALGAFVASPIWVDNQLIAVTANGEILLFTPHKRKNQ